jgi:hypothetical protein
MPITNNNNNPTVVVTEQVNKVLIATPGPQGPRGKTILNGNGAPADNLGFDGDFYYDKETTRFYGPKPLDGSWAGANNFLLNREYFLDFSWEMAQLVGPVNGVYSIEIDHGLGFHPNVTVKTSGGDILETGIDYNSINKITLIMAQPFSGTAYLS